jgi:hypothetical protein
MFQQKHNLILLLSFILGSSQFSWSQVPKDLARSVPLWVEQNELGESLLKWLPDENAEEYRIYTIDFAPFVSTPLLAAVDGSVTEFNLGYLSPGASQSYYIQKSGENGIGVGMIDVGFEIAAPNQRGRCLLAVSDTIYQTLSSEIMLTRDDLLLDGWEVDIMVVEDSSQVTEVKSMISQWYDDNYELSQSLFLLGHIPVPYSGNTAYDGHSNHYGAWSADTYYAEMDGNWTDQFVNETSPSRPENQNVPGDGKFDQTSIPGDVELEVGRVDFSNLPAFTEGEIELTRRYLEKLHLFKTGQKEFNRRALVENNFPSFDEAFGQSAWRNFPTFFGGKEVTQGNYEVQLDTSSYLCSYACGGGSYTSCGGIGSTANLWASKDIQTVFTMVFGSYFGDWDSKDNFLRSALASGDILTNAWSGRPIWQLWHMGLGKNIGYSTRFTMNASSSVFNAGYGAHSTHIGLMGDPTLRLFYPKPVASVSAIFNEGNIDITWSASEDSDAAYLLYRKEANTGWEVLEALLEDTLYTDHCISPGKYSYMVKNIRLEKSGSGSFYNSSLGRSTELEVLNNDYLSVFYMDADQDGYGNPDKDSTACDSPENFVLNDLDCDDNNPDIHPDAIDIPDNGIDEDCDGEDLVPTEELINWEIKVFPNPSHGFVQIESNRTKELNYKLYDPLGQLLLSGKTKNNLDLRSLNNGIYLIEILDHQNKTVSKHKIILD